ncbi:unnamed protein product, partial [Symbiodinium microadriaticum]
DQRLVSREGRRCLVSADFPLLVNIKEWKISELRRRVRLSGSEERNSQVAIQKQIEQLKKGRPGKLLGAQEQEKLKQLREAEDRLQVQRQQVQAEAELHLKSRASVLLQAVIRGKFVRLQLRRRHRAARTLQRGWRGYLARLRVLQMRELAKQRVKQIKHVRNAESLFEAVHDRQEAVAIRVVRDKDFNPFGFRHRVSQQSLLHAAAQEGLDALCAELVKASKLRGIPDFAAAKDWRGWTALHVAAQNGEAECLKELLQCEDLLALPGCLGRNGQTALHVAALHGETEAVKVLLSTQSFEEEVDRKDRFRILVDAADSVFNHKAPPNADFIFMLAVVMLPYLPYGYGQASMPDLVAQAVGPFLFEAAACWPQDTSNARATCCKGGAADCFTALHTRRRCCWESATLTYGLEMVDTWEPLEQSAIPTWRALNDDVSLVNWLQKNPSSMRLRPTQPMASCVQQGSGLLLSWLQSLKGCLKDAKCSIPPPPTPPLSSLSNSSLCAPLLSLSMMDAYADLWSLWSGRTPSAASADPRQRLRALRGALQRHNTHLWQVAAASRWPWKGRPLIRFGSSSGERYHTIAEILETYCRTSHRSRLIYVEVGIFEGDTPLHLAKVALPAMKEMHLIEPDRWLLQLAGARVASAAQSQRWSSCFHSHSSLMPLTSSTHPLGNANPGSLRPAEAARFVCLEPPDRIDGRVFLHFANATVASTRFVPGSLDVAFLDASPGSFQVVLHHLESYWALLRSGGILLGHDFYHVHTSYEKFNDIVGAALAFAARHGRHLFLGADQLFWIVKRDERGGLRPRR